MAKSKAPKPSKVLESYTHYNTKRTNLPPMGLVKPENDPVEAPKKKYDFDPHLDPQLQWAGKTERTSFEVPTVSLHVHERIDPRRIVDAVTKDTDGGQMSMFEDERKKSFREAIEFYKHNENWSNRLIAGDSLLVMNSLLEKEAMAGKVQMVYFDPPYGIKYGSNFMPFTNKRDVKDGKDEDLSSEPEMIKAFRDTWELGIHSYLAHIRDRMLLAKELLSETGSVFVQIGDENLHSVRIILDEIFGRESFVSLITLQKTSPLGSKGLAGVSDYLIWFKKGGDNSMKFHPLFQKKIIGGVGGTGFTLVEENDIIRKLTQDDIDDYFNGKLGNRKLVSRSELISSGLTPTCVFEIEFEGRKYYPTANRSWRTNEQGIETLLKKNRIIAAGNKLYYKYYLEDFPYMTMNNIWTDVQSSFMERFYVVQTVPRIIERCMLMTTDPGDLVLDITCGSGTTAFVAEQWGRRWMTCDSSRIALTLAKQRLLTATFDFYQLAHPAQGVDSGFKYKTVPHVTLKSIANNEPASQETLYDQPLVDNKRLRITGPFTVEAVPAPVVKNAADDVDVEATQTTIEHTKATTRREDWIAELLKSGVRGKHGDKLEFLSIESLPGTSYMQALGITKDERQERVLICFGPEHAPLEQRIVELAIEEAEAIRPSASILLFCAFAFEEEAAKDIDEANWPGVQLLKVQMNMDLQTDDLKKGGKTNESFWFIGQPDVQLHQEEDGKVSVSVHGFDYYDPKSGDVRSGKANDIAMWMVDPDYDGRAVFPAQVFLPLSGAKDGWNSLAKDLKAQIDEEKMDLYSGTVSIPFVPGKKIAVKIIDNRGIESLKIIKV
jgi:adenine-specific DNA-methyltransferase